MDGHDDGHTVGMLFSWQLDASRILPGIAPLSGGWTASDVTNCEI